MDEGLNLHSADRSHPKPAALAAVALAAVAEVLAPGEAGVAGVLRGAPVPGLLESLRAALTKGGSLGLRRRVRHVGVAGRHARRVVAAVAPVLRAPGLEVAVAELELVAARDVPVGVAAD